MSTDVGAGTGIEASIDGVSGGPLIAMELDDLHHLAGRCADAGIGLLEWTGLPVRTLADPDVLAPAALAPVSFARVEAALGEATLRLPVSGAEWGALGASVIAARGVLEEIDSGQVQRLWLDASEILQADLALRNPGASIAKGGLGGYANTVELGIGGVAGLVTAALGPVGVGAASADLERRLHDADHPPVTVPVGTRTPSAPPDSLLGMTMHLHQLAEAPDGEVEVQTIVGADGITRHVVYLPGTDDMNPLSSDSQVRDMQTNLQLMTGQADAYGLGIVTALAAAGVRPGEPVLMIGHSQGGMEAVAIAAHGSPYDITNIVTLGAPTAQAGVLPAQVQVLSIAHDGDAVPELAGFDMPAPNHVIVHFDDDHPQGLIANHEYEHYEAGAAAVQSSSNPTIRSSLAGLGPFLTSDAQATSQTFQITRSAGGRQGSA
jgi:hypothetical protein